VRYDYSMGGRYELEMVDKVTTWLARFAAVAGCAALIAYLIGEACK